MHSLTINQANYFVDNTFRKGRMQFTDVTDQARYIYTTGKLIRDRMLQIQNAHLAARGDACAFGDLSLKQIQAVMTVGRHEPISIKELASLLSVSSPSASAMVDRLVERRILERELSAEDRRRVTVRVSPLARSEMEQMEAVILNAFVDVVNRIGAEAAARWCDVLSVVKTVLLEDIASPGTEDRKG